jgi:hypothetical protein
LTARGEFDPARLANYLISLGPGDLEIVKEGPADIQGGRHELSIGSLPEGLFAVNPDGGPVWNLDPDAGRRNGESLPTSLFCIWHSTFVKLLRQMSHF